MRRPLAFALAVAIPLVAAGCVDPFARPPTPDYPRELVAGGAFSQLAIEVDHAPGYRPSDAALTHLVSTLRNVTSKSDVRLVIDDGLEGTSRAWTPEALVALEKSTRSTQHAAPTAVLHVLYPAGTFDGADAAGVTISGATIGPVTVFRDALASCRVGGPLALPNAGLAVDELERSTLLHEAGHAMGLVARGLPMVRPHEDSAHPGHSNAPESVMYWSLDSCAGLREALLHDGSVADSFDEDDRSDIRAAGGR